MPSYLPSTLGSRFSSARDQLTAGDGLPVADMLCEAEIQHAADAVDLDFGDRPIYTHAVTLWAFLTQALSGSSSCLAAVARIVVLRAALELPPCSANTGAFCKARAKLSESFLQQLTYQVGESVEDQAPDAWRWHGRRVLLVDGFQSTMDDTAENQAAYPQPKSQKRGLGFPMIRVVVLLTFATATLVGAACGRCKGKKTGETALFRKLLDRIRPGDVVVADRFYCNYWTIAMLLARGADVTFRMHQRRHVDFRRGQRLGADDHVVSWTKPQRPPWMDAAQYAAMPATLTLRELRFAVTQRGYRSREITVATSLVDGTAHAWNEVADLYHRRWHVELDIRSIKQTLKINHIACKSPAMVRRALWAAFLGYNVVRRVLKEAAQAHGLCPRQLSFAGAVQILEAFRTLLMNCPEERKAELLCRVLAAVATHKVGDRPGRCEPRRVKRRPKYPLLNKPRAEARAELLNN
jgi:putative transposase